jgi:hypothetical protein
VSPLSVSQTRKALHCPALLDDLWPKEECFATSKAVIHLDTSFAIDLLREISAKRSGPAHSGHHRLKRLQFDV